MKFFLDTIRNLCIKLATLIFVLSGTIFPIIYIVAIDSAGARLGWWTIALIVGPFYWLHRFDTKEKEAIMAESRRIGKILDAVRDQRDLLQQEIPKLRARLADIKRDTLKPTARVRLASLAGPSTTILRN